MERTRKDTPPARVIEDAVKGAMTALLLADHSMTRGSILVVEAVVDVAAKLDLDPTDSMRAALRAWPICNASWTRRASTTSASRSRRTTWGRARSFVEYLREMRVVKVGKH